MRLPTGEALTDDDAALDEAYPPKHFRNGARPPDSRRGDPDARFRRRGGQGRCDLLTPIEHHNPMEPHATVARWDGDRLTV